MPSQFSKKNALIAGIAAGIATIATVSADYTYADFREFNSTDCSGTPNLIAGYTGSLAQSMCSKLNSTSASSSTSNSSASANATSSSSAFQNSVCSAETTNGLTVGFQGYCGDIDNAPGFPSDKTFVEFNYIIGDSTCSNSTSGDQFSLSLQAGECIANQNLGGQAAAENGFVIASCPDNQTVQILMCTDSKCSENCQTYSYNDQCTQINSGNFPNELISMIGDNSSSVFVSPTCRNFHGNSNAALGNKIPVIGTVALAIAGGFAALLF